MKKSIIYAGAATIVVLCVFVYFISGNFRQESPQTKTNVQNERTDNRTNGESQENTLLPSTTDLSDSSRYRAYSPSEFEAARNKKRVYFFHAAWCPTCRAAEEEFVANLNKIPSDVVLFKTDYDTQKELKKRYGITYQHTFVSVDADDRLLQKWTGGAIDELIMNTQ